MVQLAEFDRFAEIDSFVFWVMCTLGKIWATDLSIGMRMVLDFINLLHYKFKGLTIIEEI